jgi:hypothetical protein
MKKSKKSVNHPMFEPNIVPFIDQFIPEFYYGLIFNIGWWSYLSINPSIFKKQNIYDILK